MATRILIVLAIVVGDCALAGAAAQVPANAYDGPPPDGAALIARFRPYIKSSRADAPGKSLAASLEQHRPVDWTWFVSHSSLVTNYKPTQDGNCHGHGTDDQWPDGTIASKPDGTKIDHNELANHPEDLTLLPQSDLSKPDGQNGQLFYALHLDNASYKSGQSWAEAAAGAGIYAHVTEILDPKTHADLNKVNIEYTVLWAYNSGLCSYHHGDITTIILQYDRASDLISRVTYSVHGSGLMFFALDNATMAPEMLKGETDDEKPQYMSAVRMSVDASRCYMNAYGDNSYFFAPACFMYLARDPQTGRFEHPVVFAENNSHEFWPNPGGRYDLVLFSINILLSGPHSGNGYSYLPASVHLLGPPDNPTPGDAPFLHYNGKFGTDAETIILHRSWYYPYGQLQNPFPLGPKSAFTESNPYAELYTLGWPPKTMYAMPSSIVGNVGVSGATYALNDPSKPFPDLATALSFVPAGGSISIAPGTYTVSSVLDHPVYIEASANGAVILQ